MWGLEQEITLNAAVEQETAWRKRGEKKNKQTTYQNTKQKIPPPHNNEKHKKNNKKKSSTGSKTWYIQQFRHWAPAKQIFM